MPRAYAAYLGDAMTGQRTRGSASTDALRAPVHPPDFWERPELRAALLGRHFGRFLRAYRVAQTPPVQQTRLADWLGITPGFRQSRK
jgi:hypothetical protein